MGGFAENYQHQGRVPHSTSDEYCEKDLILGMEIRKKVKQCSDSTSSFRYITAGEWLQDMHDGGSDQIGGDSRNSPKPAKHTEIHKIAESFSRSTSLQCEDQRKQEPVGAAGNDVPISAQMLKALAAIRACKTRAILTDEQAIRIYQIKLDNQTASTPVPSSPGRTLNFRAGVVARAFGVSDKAIRDIWKGRTWLRETMHLDPARAAMAGALRPPGRPKGRTAGHARPAPALRGAVTYPSPTPADATALRDETQASWAGAALAKSELGAEEGRAAGNACEQEAVKDEEEDRGPAQTIVRRPRPAIPAAPATASPATAGRAFLRIHPSSPPPPPRGGSGGGVNPKMVCGPPPPLGARSPDRSEASLRAAATAAVAAAVAAAATAAAAAAAALAAAFAAALLHGAAAGLPASSRADDPFHDDWTHSGW